MDTVIVVKPGLLPVCRERSARNDKSKNLYPVTPRKPRPLRRGVTGFTNELKIFRTVNELNELDKKANDFIKENNIRKVISVSDTCTTDDTGATIGIIRVVAYEENSKGKK